MAMRTLLLIMLLLVLPAASAATKHTVNAVGFTFSPATITITEGDTVVFVISSIHNALEVEEATWNVNGTTPKSGGFSVPFGGGEAVPVGTGTHYYICTNHAGSSMKGRIIVNPSGPPPGEITVASLVDRDGSLGTVLDRMGKNWSLKLYKDSIGSGIVVDSVASGWTLFVDSLPPGTYVAVEADSAHWTHLSQTVDGVPQGPTGANFRVITLASGQIRGVEFLNYARNVVISDGFTFSPASMVVDSADTVRFVLDPMHNARQVDSAVWEANDTASNGGFDLPLGGGEAILTVVGTTYYVCVPHADLGMKGTIEVEPQGALTIPVADGWNLLSMPFAPEDSAVAANYPTATSSAFTYQTGYQTRSSIPRGEGYWLKFGSAQSVGLDGGIIAEDTVELDQGWNIVGTISVPVPVASITSIPGGLVTSAFFGYDAGYATADTLQPGYGYWVKAGSPGSIVLSPGPSAAGEAARIRIVPVREVPPESRPRR